MMRSIACLLLIVASGLAKAKDHEKASYPLPAGTPVEIIGDSRGMLVQPYPNYQASSGLIAYGILGSAIRNNQRSVQPLFAEMAPARLDEYFTQQLKSTLPQWLPSAELSVLDTAWSEEQILQKTAGSNGLFVAVRPYIAFSPFMDAAGGYVELWVIRARRTESGKYAEVVLEHSTFAFEPHFKGWTRPSTKATAAPWKALGAERLAQVFHQSIDQVVSMLAYHVSPEGQSEARLKNRKHDSKVLGLKVPGRLVRSGADWFWFRETIGDQLVGYGIIETSEAASTPAAD